MEGTLRSETTQQQEEQKLKSIFLVAASEKETAQTCQRFSYVCVYTYTRFPQLKWGFGQPTLASGQKKLQSAYVEEDGWKASPQRVIVSYSKRKRLLGLFQSSMGHVKSCVKIARPLVKAKYTKTPIVNQYRKGKVKSPPVRGVKQYLKPYTDKLTEPYMGDVVPIEE